MYSSSGPGKVDEHQTTKAQKDTKDLENDEIVPQIILAGVGSINESDIMLSVSSNAVVIGFNVRADSAAKKLSEKDNEKKVSAKTIAEKINMKNYTVKKLCTENKELYGSVKPTEISKLIKENEKITIKPSIIQPVKEIKMLGKFKVKVSLHSEVDAELTINVESAETIQ